VPHRGSGLAPWRSDLDAVRSPSLDGSPQSAVKFNSAGFAVVSPKLGVPPLQEGQLDRTSRQDFEQLAQALQEELGHQEALCQAQEARGHWASHRPPPRPPTSLRHADGSREYYSGRVLSAQVPSRPSSAPSTRSPRLKVHAVPSPGEFVPPVIHGTEGMRTLSNRGAQYTPRQLKAQARLQDAHDRYSNVESLSGRLSPATPVHRSTDKADDKVRGRAELPPMTMKYNKLLGTMPAHWQALENNPQANSAGRQHTKRIPSSRPNQSGKKVQSRPTSKEPSRQRKSPLYKV